MTQSRATFGSAAVVAIKMVLTQEVNNIETVTATLQSASKLALMIRPVLPLSSKQLQLGLTVLLAPRYQLQIVNACMLKLGGTRTGQLKA